MEAFKKAYDNSSCILLVYDKLANLTELEEMIRDTQLENMLKVAEFQLYAVTDMCENEKYLFLLLQIRERQVSCRCRKQIKFDQSQWSPRPCNYFELGESKIVRLC